MSNDLVYTLDVLASSPTEINQIAEGLKQPSLELATWVAEREYVRSAVSKQLSFEERDLRTSSPADFDRLIKQREEEAKSEFAIARSRESVPENMDALRELVEFTAIENLDYIDDSLNT